MELQVNEIFKKVEEYDSIIICGHVIPDGDCYGSIMGLTHVIREKYPDKKVYPVVSKMRAIPEKLEQGILPGTLDDELFSKSLVFILDLANTPRLDEKRAVNGAYIIKLDHHVLAEHFGDIEFVDTTKSSCCEIVATLCLTKFEHINELAATAFMMGLITDTGRFQFVNNDSAFFTAGKLMANHANLQNIYKILYTQKLESFKFRSYVYSNFKAEKGVAYMVFTKEEIHNLGSDADSCGSSVNLISAIDGYPIWIFFAEYDDGSVRVEIRSTVDYNINPLAVSFGGGGHKQASGCKLEHIEDYKKVVAAAQDLNKWRM